MSIGDLRYKEHEGGMPALNVGGAGLGGAEWTR